MPWNLWSFAWLIHLCILIFNACKLRDLASLIFPSSSNLNYSTKPKLTSLDSNPSSRELSNERKSTVQEKTLEKSASTSYATPYSIIKELGTGGYAIVYEGVDNRTGEIVVIKFLPRNAPTSSSGFKTEVEILTSLDHPNIIKLIDYYEDHLGYYLVLEKLGGISLYDALQQKGYFQPYEISDLIRQILSALEYLGTKNIRHGDIKLENILFVSNHEPTLKLIDFGAAGIGRQVFEEDIDGTAEYWAPEMVVGVCDLKSDVWAVGVIAYSLLVGDLPFDESDHFELLEAIVRIRYPKTSQWHTLPDEVKHFIDSLLSPEKTRLTATEALRQNWLITAH